MRFFFYGTLIDPDVRVRLFGPGVAASCSVLPARLDGWRVAGVRGKPYPAAVPRRGAVAAGVLVDGLPDSILSRLDAYEGTDYIARELEIAGQALSGPVAALVYVASPACRVTRADWSFVDWEVRHKRRVIAGLRRVASAGRGGIGRVRDRQVAEGPRRTRTAGF